MQNWSDTVWQLVQTYAIPFLWQTLGAIALWVIGSWAIGGAARLLRSAMTLKSVDKTLINYAEASARIALRVLLIIAILGLFGVETTSFAALLAAAGIAIGSAWSGLLSNLAAGVFLVVLRPFKAGDFVSVAGVEGTVREIGLFATIIDTPDNLRTLVGNSKVLADNVVNFSANAYRRVECVAQVAHVVSPAEAIARLRPRIASIANISQTPPPDLHVLGFSATGTAIAVRPFCHNDHYWQVFFDTNRTIGEVFAEAGYPAPATYQVAVADTQ
jgi:small conductance mechanosensitive channel